jgi:uncharacterized caspase-like protein
LQNLPGKVFLLLDTCHAGGATGAKGMGALGYTEALRAAMADDAGVVTMASCLPSEISLEDAAWGNGAFTKALCEGLSGKAADEAAVVSLAALDNYVTQRVKELTAGKQHPSTGRPTTMRGDLPMAVSR